MLLRLSSREAKNVSHQNFLPLRSAGESVFAVLSFVNVPRIHRPIEAGKERSLLFMLPLKKQQPDSVGCGDLIKTQVRGLLKKCRKRFSKPFFVCSKLLKGRFLTKLVRMTGIRGG